MIHFDFIVSDAEAEDIFNILNNQIHRNREEMCGISGGLLEIAEQMQKEYDEDNLSAMQRIAFRVFMREMGKLFAPAVS
jgi:tRNA A37 N6-isopentenylltransferase MiaA